MKDFIANRKYIIIIAFLVAYFCFLNFIFYQWFTENYQIQAPIIKRTMQIISPLPKKKVSLIPVPVAHAETEPSISEDISQVFGSYTPVAMELLTSDKCHENKGLNPNAYNDNTTWGGIGQDIGVFQINTTWQGVSNEAFLRDPAINIRIAWNIFVRSGYSFKMWTCGKKLGI